MNELDVKIASVMGLTESQYEKIGYLCRRCAFDDWGAVGDKDYRLDDSKTCCPVDYRLQSEIRCPIYRYGGRSKYRAALKSVLRDYLPDANKIHEDALRDLLSPKRNKRS